MKKKVALLNSPRRGGPLKWGKELQKFLNMQPGYSCKLITNPLKLIKYHFISPGDIVHAAVPLFYSIWKNPYILTVKGDYSIEKNLWKNFYNLAIKKADIVTVPSQYLKARISELSNAIVIPNAVDLTNFHQVKLNANTNKIRFLIVSNFWFPLKSKGVVNLLELLNKLKFHYKGHDFEVVVVGSGKYIDQVKSYAKKVNYKTIFTGWSDPRKLFKESDIFLYYSYHDNMPNAVLEAMSAGLPIISNNVGALPEMITNRKDGILVMNDDEYLEQVNNLMGDFNFRKKLGQAARMTIEEKFNWEKLVLNYIDIYNDILG